MQTFNYIALFFSFIIVYWCTSTAYDRVIRVSSNDTLPLLQKQSCVVTPMEINDKSMQNLSIYYSGVKSDDEQKKGVQQQDISQQDNKIQDEILKIVKEKQNTTSIDKKTETKVVPATQKITKNVQKSNDAFSVTKKSTNVFDVLE